MPEHAVISNTSPLLYLHQIGQIALLERLYGQILVPPAVRKELNDGRALGHSVPVLEDLDWVEVRPLKERSLIPAVIDLGAGEAEAIGLALSNPGSLLVLDDALGRRIAGLAGLRITGTVGVLVKAKEAGLLPQVAPALRALEQTTMRMSPALVRKALELAREL